ncbi:DUF202 domain-containing protein [Streptomyces sp. HNM0574]|uniref:DUF202 domain-containing protein n=1 Tax=Streptomyces sp. HNM0574 TaxID=2714954 RepID=UPI00146EDB56|nr:DUF202 domain-containing protein [Streptomyces sp. HNM0574]
MTGSSPVRPPGAGGAPERDPGAQPERTRLAWRRTTLTFVVSIGLAIRTVVTEGGGTFHVLTLAVGVLAWLGFLAVGHRRISRMDAAEPPPMSPALARLAALCTLTMMVVGGVLLW